MTRWGVVLGCVLALASRFLAAVEAEIAKAMAAAREHLSAGRGAEAIAAVDALQHALRPAIERVAMLDAEVSGRAAELLRGARAQIEHERTSPLGTLPR